MKISYQSRVKITAFLMLLVILLISSALWFPKVDRTVKVMDLLFVLDITQSMDVMDAKQGREEISRLDWAKAYTRQTFQQLPCGSHVGLAVFSEARSLVLINPVEICESYNDLTKMLDKITGSMAWALSSELAKASFTAIDQAKLMEPQPNIVFVTDGHEAPPLHATLFPTYKKDLAGVTGVFVGVGGDELLPIPKHDLDGKRNGYWLQNEVLHEDVYASLRRGEESESTSINSKKEHLSSQKKAYLEKLASRLEFDYIASPKKAKALINSLNTIVETREQVVKYDFLPWMTAFALLFLIFIYLPLNLMRSIKS